MARCIHLDSATTLSSRLVNVVLLVSLLILYTDTTQAVRYEFQVNLYDKEAPWQKCLEGWEKYGKNCYKVFQQPLSWEDANAICKSFGGYLAKIQGFNQNKELGLFIRDAMGKHPCGTTDHNVAYASTVDSCRVWIGLTRASSGKYQWANSIPGFQQQGFWDIGNPPDFHKYIDAKEQCCDINLNSSKLGEFRWQLSGCDKKQMFMCETNVCDKHHFRCDDGHKCVIMKSICDGVYDCDDGSDERQCVYDDCGGNLVGEKGTLHSPAYPKNYPKNALCIWRLQTPVGSRVQLQFERFDIEHKYDSVKVYDGSEQVASALFGEFSGHSIPVLPLASSSVLLVILTSDQSNEASGFNATWSAAVFDGGSSSCGGQLSAQWTIGWFTSPFFPSQYPPKLVCDWVIIASNLSDLITLHFQDFELENELDWVEVYNGDTDSGVLFERFSGSQLPKIIVSSGPSLFVRFKSDSSGSLKGFNATYSAGCSVEVRSGYAKIESPGYGVDSYPSHVNCSWQIIDPLSRNLNLIFNPLFDVEAYMDFVTVYNSSQASTTHLMVKASGTEAPQPVPSAAGGYVIQFSSDRSIERQGWSATISFDCEPINVEWPLEINTTSVKFGTVVHYQCSEGYLLQGTTLTMCDMYGVWKPHVLPVCEIVDCGSPDSPKHGYLENLSGTKYGDTGLYNCSNGYKQDGTSITCGLEGWTSMPKCEAIYCPKEPPSPHGSVMAEDNTAGALREFFCNTGYHMLGAKFSFCTTSGTWTNPVPQCLLLQCPRLMGIINGQSDPAGSVRVGEEVVITCQTGYQLEGHSHLTCQDTQDYDHPIPYCKDINECKRDGVCTDDGHHTCQNLVGSYRCVCDGGYQHLGSDQTKCTDIDECAVENGGCDHLCSNLPGTYVCYCDSGYVIYQGDMTVIDGGQLVPNKTCIAPCEALRVARGTVAYTGLPLHDGSFLYPTKAIIACSVGDIPDGPAQLLCLKQGGWSGHVSRCRVSVCTLLDIPVNGHMSYSGQTLGSTATYSCDDGFRLKGPAVRYCHIHNDPVTSEQKPLWTGPQPTCFAVDCGIPPEPANGIVSFLKTTLDSVAIYSCHCGFQLEGGSIRRCLSNGLWSGNNTHCIIKRCSTPGNPTHGSLVQTYSTFPVGSIVQFKCNRQGYHLSDPWPMECMSKETFQVSAVYPMYQVSVSSKFITGDYSAISTSCGLYYQGTAVRLLRAFVPQLQQLCDQFGKLSINVNNDTTLQIQGSTISLTGWYEMKTDTKAYLTSLCQCGQAVSSALSGIMSSGSLLMLDASQELDCSPVFLQRESVNTNEDGWHCPQGLGTIKGEGSCGKDLPACTEGCVYDSTTVTVPFSMPKSTTVTLSSLAPTSMVTPDTFSSSSTTPATITSIMASTTMMLSTASTSTAVQPTQSTMKDITMKSSTASTPVNTEDGTDLPHTSEHPSTVAWPLFLIEVEDKMEGSFTNITCIDEVHVIINSKVNEVMRDFNVKIGRNTCLNATDVILELMSGNIRFRGEKAEIFIQFSLKYGSSHSDVLEQCAEEFKKHVLHLLPAKFMMVTQQVVPQFCQHMSYVPGNTKVSRNAWDCPNGYQLDRAVFVCQRTISTPFSTLPETTPALSATAPPIPVNSIPQMMLTFDGTFSQVVNQGNQAMKACLAEYNSGLTKLLVHIEPIIQKRHENCSNIYVDVTTKLNLTLHGVKLMASVQVRLLPLSDSINLSSMLKCSSFLANLFEEPSEHLPNVTLPVSYLHNCTPIQLNPAVLTPNPDLTKYSCADGFVYNELNFLCVDEALPSFKIKVHLIITDILARPSCWKALEASVTQLSLGVMEDVHAKIQSGRLCNASNIGDRVILLPSNSTLSFINKEAIISISFVLLSLNGQSAPVDKCKSLLYDYLASSLGQPVRNMMTNVSSTCPKAVGPLNFTQASEEWGCFKKRVYHAQTHSCNRFGALEESITKTKGLMSERRRRDIHDIREDTSIPFWNTTLPQCQDQEPPVFIGCPKTSMPVYLGASGPMPEIIKVPYVTDNSRGALTITFQPSDFRPNMSYIFRQNMTLNISAVDTTGNKAVCRISIHLIDVTPPSIHCHRKLFIRNYTGDHKMIPVMYPEGLVTAADYGGLSHISYDPPPGSLVQVLKKVNITATAFDQSGNSASCSFFYMASTDRCALWELPVPAGGQGQRTCTSKIEGSVGFGVSCQVTCPQGYQFISAIPDHYICINGSVWHPHNNVPHCGAVSYTNFNLNMNLNFTYDGTISNMCVGKVSHNVLPQVRPFFEDICKDFANNTSIKIDHMGFFEQQSPFFVLKMKVSITLKSGSKNSWAYQCGTKILSKLDDFSSNVTVSYCGNASSLPPSEPQGQPSCFMGSALLGDYCVECPSGTFMNTSVNLCEICPRGQYQNQSGTVNCDMCPAATSTLTSGSTSKDQCLDMCEQGWYSPTGLKPCHMCEKGKFQPEQGQVSCLSCPEGQSTPSVGATMSSQCKDICWAGQYSLHGLQPCSSCPKHFYSDSRGATQCKECPPDRVTLMTGSNSKDDCLEVNWCRGHRCAAGSTCVDQQRFAQCLCLPGYTGELCDTDIDECSSQPCVNGASCEDGINSFTCSCKPGYEGSLCELETDECRSNPCINGLCVDGHLHFTCHCHAGYIGARCEVDIDECASNPCYNNGHCLDLVAGFQCDCSDTGYEGYTCQEKIGYCSAFSCLNNGTCHDLHNSFSCSCPPGFSGLHCEVDINECQPYPCANNALCLDQVNSFQCICQPGYTGIQCESEINECSSSPCLNGATCTDLVGDYLCTCSPGYEGKNCDFDFDDCASNPCYGAGTDLCEDGINSFSCHCLQLWQGTLCDQPVDPCKNSHCAEGASCMPVGNTFLCVCPPDFTGILCDHHIDDCESGPCMNNGTCLDDVQSFTCECIEGITGKTCDINIDECASNPCANGATCKDLINSYMCSCAAGYKGESCEENIDDCTSQPCKNGGSCQDSVHKFKCTCPQGYTGRTCMNDVDECETFPCKNGGTCINLQGHFECKCPVGYKGAYCEQDPCSYNNPCLNNATCVIFAERIDCVCLPHFTGIDCGKEKSSNFDLHFYGKKEAASRPPYLNVPPSAQLAVCLWLLYASPDATETVLTVSRSDKVGTNLHNSNEIMLEMKGETLSVSLEGEKEPVLFTMRVTDGLWHHVCYQWEGTQHALYVDGVQTVTEKYGTQVSLPDRLKLVLGHPASSSASSYFQGEISQVNFFSTVLSPFQISKMASNCSNHQLPGDIFAWPQTDAYLFGDVTPVVPSVCGKLKCPPGFHGTACNMMTDKTVPTVVFCPGDQNLINTSAMVQVTWEEPVFEDNVGITRIKQTHRSGQAFHQGEYIVTYVAYDAENNSAECSFEIIIKPFDCVEPPPPRFGSKVCQTWLHGSFCSISCFPSYTFVELPPPFYTCGKLGFWDPPRGNPFRFPQCTLMIEPEVTLIGVMKVTGPGCSDQFRATLKSRFSHIMAEMDSLLGLCKTDFCDFEHGFSVTCDEIGNARSKRDTRMVYQVAVNLDLPANSSAVRKKNGNWVAEEIVTAVKQGHFNNDMFTVDPNTSQLSVDFLCQPGQVLREMLDGNITRICLDCPEGYYYNSELKDCHLCEEGSYNDQPRQFDCQLCPAGTTTNAPGTISQNDCFEICMAGSYYNLKSHQCQLCSIGQYQDSIGQTSCINCPMGQTTNHQGSTAVHFCGNLCKPGQEISGSGLCQPCPKGSYLERYEHPVCLPCPYGWTTPTIGSISWHNCSLVMCDRGHRWTADNNCELCPAGTYQAARGAEHCIPCGVGLTTGILGAVSQSQCYRGPVDECNLEIHQCDKYATCVDTEEKYICQCQPGLTGDGINCKVSAGLSSAVAGGIAGSAVAVIVIIIIAVICYLRHRSQAKKSNDRIYRSHKVTSATAFCNEGYESVQNSNSAPSQLILQEQSYSTSSSSTLSIAPRWNRSTFANSDEDETDACWFESLHLDDLSLGSDAFTRMVPAEAENYF